MKRHAADRPNTLHPGMALMALCAAALLLLAGGCGQFNDNPAVPPVTATVTFPSPSGTTSSPLATWDTGNGEAVVSIVVGAIVIRHCKSNPSSSAKSCIEAYNETDIAGLNDAQREALQKDAEQSVVYLDVSQFANLNETTKTVSFQIPPKGAGNWQLVGVGLRNKRTKVGDVKDSDPIWYGFTATFLNDKVAPGDTLTTSLVMRPGCSLNSPPQQGVCP